MNSEYTGEQIKAVEIVFDNVQFETVQQVNQPDYQLKMEQNLN